MLEAIRGVPEVQTIVFQQAMNLSDEALKHLRSLPNLTRLEFRGQPEINNANLSLIAPCQQVEVLVIRYCKVTDEAYRYFSPPPAKLFAHTHRTSISWPQKASALHNSMSTPPSAHRRDAL